jgi:hypothetical protein
MAAAEVAALSDTDTLTVTGDSAVTSTDTWIAAGTVTRIGATFNKFTFDSSTLLIETGIDAAGIVDSGPPAVTAPSSLGALGAGGFRIVGEAAGDGSGNTVSSLGDVNNDGFADFGVAKVGGESGPGDVAYVVFGAAGLGAEVLLSNIAAGSGGFRILQQSSSSYLSQISDAGDVNGDGIDDLIVGAYGANAAYVVFGTETPAATIDLNDVALGTGGFRISGEVGGDLVGISVSSAGDVNGDGIDDLIVGARGNDAGGTNAGAAYVIFGTASSVTAVDLSAVALGTGGFKITGEAAGDLAGRVSSAGDVNGDGFDDLVVGASGNDAGGTNAGAAYVVFGAASSPSAVNLDDVALGTGGFRISGEVGGDQAGISVSSAGDVNGDGIDDLLVGALTNDAGGTNAGAAYVIFGTDRKSVV